MTPKNYPTRNLAQAVSLRICSRNCSPKLLFLERIQKLLPNEQDYQAYLEILKKEPVKSIRCNTLKISPTELKKKLEKNSWEIKQPFKDYPEIMIVENELLPGELGRSIEHLLGHYYVQEISSMLPILVLNPKFNEKVLDLCASPGSKTTQAAAKMENKGLLVANEVNLGRLKVLSANLERCGIMNELLVRRDGVALCKQFEKEKILFDKILLDAPCSGEGTIRSTSKTLEMWNIKTIENLSRLQKSLIASAIGILKPNGILVYSTCTHAPEENEEVIDFALKNFNVEIQEIKLPINCREGIISWENKAYNKQIKKSCRIYPQDADTEGFFIAKIKKLK